MQFLFVYRSYGFLLTQLVCFRKLKISKKRTLEPFASSGMICDVNIRFINAIIDSAVAVGESANGFIHVFCYVSLRFFNSMVSPSPCSISDKRSDDNIIDGTSFS